MSEISQHVGSRIRQYRKMNQMTLQNLADAIHKSRASVSKYENGEITVDIETLFDICTVLEVDIGQLTDYYPIQSIEPILPASHSVSSPFFDATQLYFYYFDGRDKRLKDGVIRIHKTDDQTGAKNATFAIHSFTPSGRSSDMRYAGKVVYSDMLIRFSFVNQYNALEEDLLYIYNPWERRDFTEGLLCGISSKDFKPCAFKCLVTLTPQEPDDTLKEHLLLTSKEIKRWHKLNMLIVDNNS